jgi:hypothetical protein
VIYPLEDAQIVRNIPMGKVPRPLKPHDRKPRKDPKVHWRVDTIPDAREGDTITWSAPGGADGTDITIWFPPDPGWDPLKVGMVTLRAGSSITRTVPQGAREDHYHYSVFCHSDGKMAEGSQSPPEMIIE